MFVTSRSIAVFTLALGSASLACSDNALSEHQRCLAAVHKAYAGAQREWQRALRDLIVMSRPEFGELSHISSELQLLMIDESTARFRYLLRVEPHRLRAGEGLARFVNFGVDWSDADEGALLADESYRRLQERLDSLRPLNDGHSDWPALRRYLSNELAGTSAYSQAMSAFQQRRYELEDRLAACSGQ